MVDPELDLPQLDWYVQTLAPRECLSPAQIDWSDQLDSRLRESN